MIGQKRKVLIHCAAGISRSASFTIAYLMRKNGTGFQATLEFVRSKRKCIFPNSGFRIQLQ
jgi:atypical dual specificity phosphatase